MQNTRHSDMMYAGHNTHSLILRLKSAGYERRQIYFYPGHESCPEVDFPTTCHQI